MAAEVRALDPDPSDPAEILRLLPEQYHPQFLREYSIAIEQARRPEQYRMLQGLLRLWRLRALAYSDPDFASRQSSAPLAATDDVPAEHVISGWPR
jgi:hypothetical protein